MFPATNSHMCVHMQCARVSMDGRDWRLRTFRSGASTPSPELLACLRPPAAPSVGSRLSPMLLLPLFPVVSVDFCASLSLAWSPLMSV